MTFVLLRNSSDVIHHLTRACYMLRPSNIPWHISSIRSVTYFLSTQTAFNKKNTAYETSSNLYNEKYKKREGLRCEIHE